MLKLLSIFLGLYLCNRFLNRSYVFLHQCKVRSRKWPCPACSDRSRLYWHHAVLFLLWWGQVPAILSWQNTLFNFMFASKAYTPASSFAMEVQVSNRQAAPRDAYSDPHHHQCGARQAEAWHQDHPANQLPPSCPRNQFPVLVLPGRLRGIANCMLPPDWREFQSR